MRDREAERRRNETIGGFVVWLIVSAVIAWVVGGAGGALVASGFGLPHRLSIDVGIALAFVATLPLLWLAANRFGHRQ